MKIPVEDLCEDIVSKSQRGLEIGTEELAAQAGISRDDVVALRKGKGAAAVVEKVAPVLGLNTRALLESFHSSWEPEERIFSNLFVSNTPFKDMTVNAYLVWDESSREALIFDTGVDALPLLDAVEKNALDVRAIFITHTHLDHIYALDSLRKAYPNAEVFVGRLEPLEGATLIDEGFTYSIQGFNLQAIQTSGHSVGGMSYIIEGAKVPIAITGDSLFAGSMGGAFISYEDALRNNKEKLLTLDPSTVICPGHGPISTIEEEQLHNPFFAR